MNLLKKLLKGIGIVLILFLVFILISLFVDSRRTSYLAISAHPDLETNSYLIRNVNVVPMTKDTVLKGKSVLVENGRIKQIADQIPSNGLNEIDAANGFLSPGLVDMHVHIWDRYDLGVYLANGVTTVRNLRGFPMHLRIKEDIAEGKIIAPQLFTSGPILTGPYDPGDEKIQVQDPQMAKELVREHKAKGYDCIKTYAGMPLNIFNAVLEQAVAALEQRVSAHQTPLPAPLPAIIPARYRLNGQVLSFFSTMSQFATSGSVAMSELKIEMLFPADEETRVSVEALFE